jgi:hypothetical protein
MAVGTEAPRYLCNRRSARFARAGGRALNPMRVKSPNCREVRQPELTSAKKGKKDPTWWLTLEVHRDSTAITKARGFRHEYRSLSCSLWQGWPHPPRRQNDESCLGRRGLTAASRLRSKLIAKLLVVRLRRTLRVCGLVEFWADYRCMLAERCRGLSTQHCVGISLGTESARRLRGR